MSDLDYIRKGSAKVNGQYSFVSHDQVTAAIHPLLIKHRLVIIPSIEDLTQENNRTSIKLCIVFKNPDAKDDAFHVYSYGYGVDNGDKGIGKAYSYAWKYALLKTFCLETGDDPDNDANARYEPAKCLEFDLSLPVDMDDKERARLLKFIEHSASHMKKDVEDVKREALRRMPEFLAAFKSWKPKKA
jgi:hypothetical protein